MQILFRYPDFSTCLADGVLEDVACKASKGACDEVREWYRRLPEDWFDRTDPFPDGSPRHGGARTFAHALSSGWYAENSGTGFSLLFSHSREGGSPWGLRLQQYGGSIYPKNRRALAIPVTARARGLRVAQFCEQEHRLFAVGRKDGERLGSLVWEDRDGGLHAAYALRRRAVVKPLRERRGHDALPSSSELVSMARPYFLEALSHVLNP